MHSSGENGNMVFADIERPLPPGWVWTTIAEICSLVNGRAFKPSEWSSAGIPIIRIQNLNDLEASYNYCNFNVDEKYIIDRDQLLFAWSGTPGTSFGAHIWNGTKAVLNQHIFKVEIDERFLNKRFLMYLFNNNVDDYIRQAHGTAGLAHITKGKFEGSVIPLPPLPEQRRIVAKIEELFSKLDAGVEALKKVQAELKRYRQSVLKHAFEGKLTEEWRKQNAKNSNQSAVELLKQVKEERKKKLGKKFKEVPPVDTSELLALPEGWVWARVGEVSKMIQYGTSEKATEEPSGIPVLRMGNIQDGKLDFEKLKYLPNNLPELEELRLSPGDVLFNRTNSSELVGKTAVYKSYYPPATFASYLIRVQVDESVYQPDFLSWYINSIFGRQYISSVVSQQVGQANVNGTKLAMMPIPFCNPFEQQIIVSEIDRLFSIADEVEKVIEQSLLQADRLRQSILKRAFEGKLVPQDPSDESAVKLLERIKEEREKQQKETNTNRKKLHAHV